jgi:hypothetical protein
MNTKPTIQWRIAVVILSALTVVSCSNAAPTKAEVAKAVVAGVAASWGGKPGAYVFEVDSLRVEGDWAYVLCRPKAMNPADQGDGQYFALLRKVDGSWKVLEMEGASDLDLVEYYRQRWKKKYPKAPDKLFNS